MTPYVGMGATIHINGDAYPCTVVRVGPSGRRLWIRRDRVMGAEVFVPCVNVPEEQFTLDKYGPTWRRRGCMTLTLGEKRWHWVKEI